MAYTNKPKSRPGLCALYRAKIDAIIRQDIEALHEINNRIFYATLDPTDPEYAEKLARHKAYERELAAERKAKTVIEKTGKPFCFEDSLNAIEDAIESAVGSFERYPCPQHAADLLGLIECRSLLYESDAAADLGPALGEDD